MWYNYSRELHKSSLHKNKTLFRACIVVQDAEGSLSMPSTKQQDNKKSCVVLLEPNSFGKCSIISAKCACKVQVEGFENAWNGVCGTRDACDKALQGFLCVFRAFLSLFG